MEQYKLINAELMNEVQRQRIIIGDMRKTEVLLKKQLFEEHELRLSNTQYIENKMKCAIRTLLRSLDLNLEAQIDGFQTCRSKPSQPERACTFNVRQACSELRRSSGLLHSPMMISPIKDSVGQRPKKSVDCVNEEFNPTEPSCINENITAGRESPQPQPMIDLQVNVNSHNSQEDDDRYNSLRISTSVNGEIDEMIYSIIEETEIDKEENTSSTIDLSEIQTLSIPSVDYSMELIASQGTQNKTENSMHEQLCQNLTELKLSSQSQANVNTKSKAENSNQEIIQCVRHNADKRSPIQATVPCTLTPRRSQLSFSSFNDIVNRLENASTPLREETNSNINQRSTFKKQKRAHNTNNSTSSEILAQQEQSSTEGRQLRHSSRSCRPGSLKEPSLRSKLRNEDGIKSKR